MILYFDTETTGLASKDPKVPHHSRIVEIAWAWMTYEGKVLRTQQLICNPLVEVPAQAAAVHGLTTEMLQLMGCSYKMSMKLFFEAASRATILSAHNIDFDIKMVTAAAHQIGLGEHDTVQEILTLPRIDTCSRRLLKLPMGERNSDKIKLGDAHAMITQIPFTAHQALDDVLAGCRLLQHALALKTVRPEKLVQDQMCFALDA